MDPRKNPYAPGAGTIPPELAGRDDIIEKSSIALDRCRNGLASRGIFLVGLRGVGKTVLLTHLALNAEANGFVVVSVETPEKRSLPALLIPHLRTALLQLDRIQAANNVVKRALKALGGFVGSMKLKFDDIEFGIDLGQEPGKGISEIQWESFQLNASSQTLTGEIERVLKENELLITDWAPVHLANILKTWFWKDTKETSAVDVWQKTCCYLYLPRLKDESVFRATLAAGTSSPDFFAIAYGKDGDKYTGFSFGKSSSPIFDGALLLIEPNTAQSYVDKLKAAEQAAIAATQPTATPVSGSTSTTTPNASPQTGGASAVGQQMVHTKKQFYGTIDLDPVKAKKEFSDIVDEVIQQFATRADVKIRISIEIQAETGSKFDEGIQRSVKENCKVLKFKTSEFE